MLVLIGALDIGKYSINGKCSMYDSLTSSIICSERKFADNLPRLSAVIPLPQGKSFALLAVRDFFSVGTITQINP
jgi:hypothetical protein